MTCTGEGGLAMWIGLKKGGLYVWGNFASNRKTAEVKF